MALFARAYLYEFLQNMVHVVNYQDLYSMLPSIAVKGRSNLALKDTVMTSDADKTQSLGAESLTSSSDSKGSSATTVAAAKNTDPEAAPVTVSTNADQRAEEVTVTTDTDPKSAPVTATKTKDPNANALRWNICKYFQFASKNKLY